MGMSLILAGISIVATMASSVANTTTTFPLWENTPMAQGTDVKDIPTLTYYPAPAESATDCGVVICPGGGYSHLAMDHEGKQIAEWFNSIGVSAFVLRYRLGGDGYPHPVPLMDAQRAIRLIHSKATDYKLDLNKIGIIGFSAGGHLASSAGTHFDNPVVPSGYVADAVDGASCRPDFMILVYPVISMEDDITHKGSKKSLLGSHPEAALVELMSNEKQVTAQTPPTFLVHASDDTAVLPENSIRFYQMLLKAGVPAEMHLYLKGGHGFGIRPQTGPAAQWPQLCQAWMQQLGFLAR